jgi:hypothetical protein
MSSAVAELKEEAGRIACLFRIGQEVVAQQDAVVLAERLMGFASVERVAQMPAWVEWIGWVMSCQQSQDWLGLADYLDYELVDLLERSR